MALDPQLTIIRTRDVGADFYDEVLSRVQQDPNRPSGTMFHFSGTFEGEFFSVSAYRDPEESAAMFNDVTGPQLANIVGEAGGGPDISRDEFAITSYTIHDDEDLQGMHIVKPGAFLAVLVSTPELTGEVYRDVTSVADFPGNWPDGLVIHVAGAFGNHWGVFDVWRGDADLASFYGGRIAPAVKAVAPENADVAQNPSAIVLHSLYINSNIFDNEREFLREK